jgi:hypothetical protein
MSLMWVIPHRFKKIGVHNLVVRRIFSDILVVLGLKKVEKHWIRGWVGPKAGLRTMKKRNITCPCRKSNPGHAVHSPSLYRLSYPGYDFYFAQYVFTKTD